MNLRLIAAMLLLAYRHVCGATIFHDIPNEPASTIISIFWEAEISDGPVWLYLLAVNLSSSAIQQHLSPNASQQR